MLCRSRIPKYFRCLPFVNFYRDASKAQISKSARSLPNLIPTEGDLKLIEENIVLRQYENNVPLIRSLIQKLKDRGPDTYIQNQLQNELDKLPNTTNKRFTFYGNEPHEVLRISAIRDSETVKEFSEICKRMNLFRIENLGNFTGHKSYYLNGSLATLEQALLQYALKFLKENGFRLVSVPDILPSAIIAGCGMQTEGERTQVYKLDSDMCLSGTSEMALAGFFIDEIFEESDLPLRIAAVSRCYRAETSGLQEERGIYRVHQFSKVEMFAICSEEQSEGILDEFKDVQISLFRELELNIRLLNMPPFELGASAHQKYDVEAWMPGKKMWGEISSCSNCTDYQAKRLNIRYRGKDKKIKFVHTVNGTAAAIPRLLLSIIESHQIANDTISIPKVLRRFMNKVEIKKDKRIPEIKLVKFLKPS